MSKEDKDEKNKSAIDKVIMGAIIGTAIGSAVGVSVAPKKGEETRGLLKDKAKDISGDVKEVGTLTRETTMGFFRLFKNLIFRKKKVKRANEDNHSMRAIPSEPEIIPPEYVDRD